MTDPFAEWDAGYVLGALAPDDRRRYEEHLAGCASCSAAVRELAGVPGILGDLPAADAESLRDATPAPSPRPETVRVAARRALRRQRRTRLLALAAVLLLLAGGSSLAWALGRAVPPATLTLASARTLEPVGGSHLYAELRVTPVGWGTRLDWDCDYRGTTARPDRDGPHSATYDLVVSTDTGSSATVATWTSDGGRATRLVAATAIPADSIRSIEIRLAGSTRPLARVTY